MFRKFKDRLKSWFKSSEDKTEPEKEKPKKQTKIEQTTHKIQEKQAEKQEQEFQEKTSFFSKIRDKFRFKITDEYFSKIWDDLELILLENNVSIKVIEMIKSDLSSQLINKEIEKNQIEQEIKTALKSTIENLFIEPFDLFEKIKSSEKPFVILFVGINGSGKTTTIAKIANLLKQKNKKIVLAAGDTFRAASIEQLSLHATKLKIPIIKHDYNSDPAAVGFDAIKYAKANNIDVVLIDTAGRMHTKTDLIREMEKICRVTNPDLKIFIGESITGNDATEQAQTFNQAIDIDGIILSKTDVDEKGGTAISVSKITGKPILYLGTGQEYSDLEKFNKDKLIKELGL